MPAPPRPLHEAAGFVRIREGTHPLDASGVHPERYALVERIAKERGVELATLVGNEELARGIPCTSYPKDEVGLAPLADIQHKVSMPGLDPRETFTAPTFRDDVRKLEDVSSGMVLEGVVTNVTAIGAIVDFGVHQDGLVHVSQLADRFVKDPHAVVKGGERVKVRVLEADLARKRLALFMKQAPK